MHYKYVHNALWMHALSVTKTLTEKKLHGYKYVWAKNQDMLSLA